MKNPNETTAPSGRINLTGEQYNSIILLLRQSYEVGAINAVHDAMQGRFYLDFSAESFDHCGSVADKFHILSDTCSAARIAELEAEVNVWKGMAIGNQINISSFMDRDRLGREVREAWVAWAKDQPGPKPSWLEPYDNLSEPDKEADRRIGEHIAGFVSFIRAQAER